MAVDGLNGLGQAISQVGRMDGKIEDRLIGKGNAGNVAEGMGQALSQAIEQLDQGQRLADTGVAKLVAGEPVELHHVMLQMEQSMINMNLAVQVRNKVIEAYQEIQRIQL